MKFKLISALLLQLMLLLPLLCLTAAAEPIRMKIGASLPLSGRLAVAGQDTRAGIQLALEEFKSPLVAIEVVFDDNRHEGKQAASSARKLLDIDQVDVLVSMWDMAEVVAPLAEKKQIPHLAIRWNPQIADKYRYTFTVESTYRSYVESLLSLLRAQGIKTVGVITEESQGWVLAADYLKEESRKFGIVIKGEERFNPDSLDNRMLVTRLAANQPEMVLIFSNPPHLELLITQLRQQAPGQAFTGYFEILEDPAQVAGIPFVAQFEVAEWFVRKFHTRFGHRPKSRAAQAYDIIKLIALATGQTRAKPTPQALTAAARSEQFKTGAAGKLFVTGERVIESECVWKIAVGDRFVMWEK